MADATSRKRASVYCSCKHFELNQKNVAQISWNEWGNRMHKFQIILFD